MSPLQGSTFIAPVTQGCGDTASKKARQPPTPLMQSVIRIFVSRSLRHHPGLVYIAPLGLVPVAVWAAMLHWASVLRWASTLRWASARYWAPALHFAL